MKRYCFELGFGLILLAGFMAFRRWQNPSSTREKLAREDIDRYLAAAQTLHAPPDVKARFLSRLQTWMETDDGRPFYNLNLMRYRAQLQREPGDPDFNGTPEASNAHYEALVTPMLLKIGGYPTFAGNVTEPNLVGFDSELDNWSRVLIARYPSRRAFLNLLSDPAYQRAEPYKSMALELVLVPTQGRLVLPDATWLAAGACIIAFLAAGWIRASARGE